MSSPIFQKPTNLVDAVLRFSLLPRTFGQIRDFFQWLVSLQKVNKHPVKKSCLIPVLGKGRNVRLLYIADDLPDHLGWNLCIHAS